MTAEQLRDDPLDVARGWILHAAAIADDVAEHERREPGFGKLHAEITGAGPRQFDATQRAAYMALVSIAGDVRRIADGQAAERTRRAAAEGADD